MANLVFVRGLHRGAGLHVVRRGHDDHAGDRAHEREVLAALVSGAVLADGDAAVSRADLHVEVRIADGVEKQSKKETNG